ncbi:heterokaryon incompatibility protein-domain-containing protein [Cladorrhinum samala]|uniref:Heterokaryon incompatibility protein-domain-containing protein n=1 Tax=Cladorrhinum samala TaxID=585594 RepID=A0AAV9HHT3_9PEZI|nr:heterokaryon incompatibility protein-domain-containing protein [Cladorrhinum samala]
MTRTRSQSLPLINRPHQYPPYKYQPLSSPRHVRIIRLMHYDPTHSRVFVMLSDHELSTLHKRFTALSYTWGSAIDPLEEQAQASIISSDRAYASKNPRDVELVVVPPEAFETFRRNDDLSIGPHGSMVDLYTTPVSTITVVGNLSDFFRTYMTETWPKRHAESQRCGGPSMSMAEITNLWIDAVCIDQANDQEIAAQVPLMGEVYSSAGRVLVWLGADEARLSVFQWWHETVYPRMQLLLEQAGDMAIMHLRSSHFADAKLWKDLFDLTPPTHLGARTWLDVWADFWIFYRSRRYFHRVWIVQEVVLSHHLHIYCAKSELSWKVMGDFLNILEKIQWVDAIGDQVRKTMPLQYPASSRNFGIGDIFEWQRHHNNKLWHKGGWVRHWFGVIGTVRSRNCFKPQDYVYATIGILQQILPSHIPFPIPVDPSHTPEQVFTLAAAVILKNWPELSLFGFMEYPFSRNFHSLPSWALDLTTGDFPWPLGLFDSPFRAGIVLSPDHRKRFFQEDWAEARSTAPIPPFRHINPIKGTFVLHGKKVDTIKRKYPCADVYNTELAVVAIQVLAELPSYYEHLKFHDDATGGMKGQWREAALIHTMTCFEITNQHRGNIEEQRRLTTSFRDWLLFELAQVWSGADLVEGVDPDYRFETVSTFGKHRNKVLDCLVRMEEHRAIPGLEEIQATAVALRAAKLGKGEWPDVTRRPLEFKDQTMRVMAKRCLFVTENGWLGICLDVANEDDEVWVLEGGAVPYVLRKTGDEVEIELDEGRLWGETYVHGIMDGEFTREKDEAATRWEDVILV